MCVLSSCTAVGLVVTLQVSRRVQIFLVSGFITPHCLLRSHSFPVGKAVPMNPDAICKKPTAGSCLFLPKAWEELGLRQKSLWPSSLALQPSRETSAGCKNQPWFPFPAQTLLLWTPSPKQGNTYQQTKTVTGTWTPVKPAVSGASDLSKKRDRGQQPKVRKNT